MSRFPQCGSELGRTAYDAWCHAGRRIATPWELLDRFERAMWVAAGEAAANVAGVWQAIDTAPEDDTAVLVALPSSNIAQSARFRNGGWVICWDLHRLSEHDQPSYWMPMPDIPEKPYRFDKTYCSQCGKTFGQGNHGFSHCENHKNRRPIGDT